MLKYERNVYFRMMKYYIFWILTLGQLNVFESILSSLYFVSLSSLYCLLMQTSS